MPLRSYEVLLRERELAEGPWEEKHVEGGASILIPLPLPYGGVLIVGEKTVTYHSGSYFVAVQMRPALIRAYAKVDSDGSRWLLGDDRGEISILALHTAPAPAGSAGGAGGSGGGGVMVAGLQLQPLGITSAPSAICYLDGGLVFVGSSYGDSHLIRLLATGGGNGRGAAAGGATAMEVTGDGDNECGALFEIVETMVNLGPVVDFCCVDLERQGQGQVRSMPAPL